MVFPNPIAQILNISVPADVVFEKVQIIDLNGKVGMEQVANNNQVNVQNLSNGVYFLNAFAKGSQFSLRFVKDQATVGLLAVINNPKAVHGMWAAFLVSGKLKFSD